MRKNRELLWPQLGFTLPPELTATCAGRSGYKTSGAPPLHATSTTRGRDLHETLRPSTRSNFGSRDLPQKKNTRAPAHCRRAAFCRHRFGVRARWTTPQRTSQRPKKSAREPWGLILPPPSTGATAPATQWRDFLRPQAKHPKGYSARNPGFIFSGKIGKELILEIKILI